MNHIEQIRTDIKRAFTENVFTKGDSEIFVSPTNNFRLEATNHGCENPNWDITKVEVYNQHTNEKIFDFFSNDGHFFYAWLETNNIEYLVCAEDLCGGQTVLDLTSKKMAGYSPGEDGFIWVNFHLSPNGKTLATIGCYWAGPYVIKLFDFSKPLDLPLIEIREIELIDNDEIITAWDDNETLKTKGIKREREWEIFDDGSGRSKIISETPVERLININ